MQSLAAEYGVSKATVFNWVHAYRKECQTNDSKKSQLELMEEVRRLRQEKAELEKENLFLKSSGILCEENRLVAYRFIKNTRESSVSGGC